MGDASFFLLITFPRFNRPRGETSRGQFGAVVPGFEPDLHICSLRPWLSALDSAATSSPLNYFSSPAQGRDQRSNPQSKFSAGPLSFCSSAPYARAGVARAARADRVRPARPARRRRAQAPRRFPHGRLPRAAAGAALRRVAGVRRPLALSPRPSRIVIRGRVLLVQARGPSPGLSRR